MINFPLMLKVTAKDPYPQFEHMETRNFVNTCELKALYETTQATHFISSHVDLRPLCSMFIGHFSSFTYI